MVSEKQLAHKLFKSAKYNRQPFDEVAKRFGVTTIKARELISKYYGDIINPDMVPTRQDLIKHTIAHMKKMPIVLFGPSGSGKTQLCRELSLKYNTHFIDLAVHRTSDMVRREIADRYKYKNMLLIFEHLESIDGRTQTSLAGIISSCQCKVIVTTLDLKKVSTKISSTSFSIHVVRPDIMDVTNYILRKFPSWKGDTSELYDRCRGDMRRIIRCITDDIIDENLPDQHIITPQQACGLVLNEEDREKVMDELYNIEGDSWYFVIQFLRQNLQYANPKGLEILSLVDEYKFLINRDILFALIASIPKAKRKLRTIYFPSNPRKTKKVVEEKVTRSLPVRNKAVKKTFLKKFLDPNDI